jgi:hypothetical protein
VSKPAKYVPKHRHAHARAVTATPRKVLRKTLVMSSLAVAATGVAVSSGVLSTPASVTSAAQDLGSEEPGSSSGSSGSSGSSTDSSSADRDDAADLRRDPVVSRSSDRRAGADPAKKKELSVSGGPAVTRQVDVAQGDPHDIARALMPQFGFSADQFGCLDSLWTRESGWNPSASNPSSGAYGIPQSLPGSKMASAGADWQTNPATQIEWGLGYIRDSYGSPCGAWGHSESYGWY